MQATVSFVDKMTFLGTSGSGHTVVLDTIAQNGGSNRGATPMEQVLLAVGSCSGMDVVSILRKKRITFDHFDVRMNGNRRDEHPRIFTDIELEYVFKGQDLEEKRKHLEDAVRLSQERYCSVAGMLSGTVNLTWKVTIEPADAN